VPPSPNRLVEDITEIMHKEQSIDENNESKTENVDVKNENDADYKENEQPAAKKMKTFDNSWESSDISFLAETPVSCSNK
jgi:hypothetical protein